jgi:hypothetical protein
MSLRVQQHAALLQVAVQDAALVRVMDRTRRGGDQPGPRPWVVHKAHHLCRQAAAFHHLHREVVLAAVLADVVDRHAVRVVKLGRRFRLGAEALRVVGRRRPAGQIIFSATRQLALICLARNATPMPPRPSSLTIS